MTLRLDRMAIEEIGANPRRLAEAIHRQLGSTESAVPVDEIALALDIVQIRIEPLTSFEGALVTGAERDRGKILVNERSNPRRRRFTIGHELLHFLNPRHVPTHTAGFWCDKKDLRAAPRGNPDRHGRQESEANTFAIELLAPRGRLKPHLAGSPDLAAVLSISDALDISREAAVRRYVELHLEAVAVVFSQSRRIHYSFLQDSFPGLAVGPRELVPDLPPPTGHGLTDIDEVAASEWLTRSAGTDMLTAQTLHQRDGWATTLLHWTPSEEDDVVEDTVQRYARFGDGD